MTTESAAPSKIPLTQLPGVHFVPVGGLGQVGMNCFALVQDGEILVVDAGITFPDDDVGVDVVIPDFTWLTQNQAAVRGIFITHGHEDHIGALPYLLRGFKNLPPVFAPAHAAALILERLKEHHIPQHTVQEVTVGERYAVGPFFIEPVPVAHSIIDATALCIETSAGRIFHTGDFDLDECQPAGHLTDGFRIKELGAQGVRLLLSDSTNVDRDEREGSEADVEQALSRLVEEASARVVVTLFSSNIHRLKALVAVAQKTERKVCVLGRSLRRQLDVAVALGRLRVPSHLLVSPDAAQQLPPGELLILAGGSQAEAPSSLRRLSLGTHHQLKLAPGDRVILSSRIIPGNERPVHEMVNDLLRLQIEVRWQKTDRDIHTSGHAARREQTEMIEWTCPDSFVPLHGTLHHLLGHQALAKGLGVSDSLVVENGQSVFIPPAGPIRFGPRVPAGQVRIAYGGRELSPEARGRRLELGRSGVVSVGLAINEQRRLVAAPSVQAHGIVDLDESEAERAGIAQEVEQVVAAYDGRRALPLAEVVRRSVKSSVLRRTGVRASVLVNEVLVLPRR